MRMKTATTHHAKTHLSQLLRDVQAGETVIILSGKTPVAKLTAIDTPVRKRPPVGTVTSAPLKMAEDALAPLSGDQLNEWGI